MAQTTSAKSLVKSSLIFTKDFFKDNLSLTFKILILSGLLSAILLMIMIYTKSIFLIFFASILSFYFISYKLYKVLILASSKHQISSLDFLSVNKKELKTFVNFCGASIVYVLMVIIGLALLIIPGIYLASKYLFVTILIAEKNLSIKQAFKKSAEMTKNNIITLFFVVLLLILTLTPVVILLTITYTFLLEIIKSMILENTFLFMLLDTKLLFIYFDEFIKQMLFSVVPFILTIPFWYKIYEIYINKKS